MLSENQLKIINKRILSLNETKKPSLNLGDKDIPNCFI